VSRRGNINDNARLSGKGISVPEQNEILVHNQAPASVVAQKTLPGWFCAQNLPGSRTSGGQNGSMRNPDCDAQLTGSNPVSCLIHGLAPWNGVVEPRKQVIIRASRRAITLDMDAGSIPAHGLVSCLRAGVVQPAEHLQVCSNHTGYCCTQLVENEGSTPPPHTGERRSTVDRPEQ
jgi:hypothetical protein